MRTPSFFIRAAVELDGLFDRAEIVGNLLVEPPGDNVRKHFAFARGQGRDLRLRSMPVRRRTCRDLVSCSSARAMAANKSLSLTGLVRKSMAPAFMARTLVGMSPFPVMKMTGR